jgi:hypothetical protein
MRQARPVVGMRRRQAPWIPAIPSEKVDVHKLSAGKLTRMIPVSTRAVSRIKGRQKTNTRRGLSKKREQAEESS